MIRVPKQPMIASLADAERRKKILSDIIQASYTEESVRTQAEDELKRVEILIDGFKKHPHLQ